MITHKRSRRPGNYTWSVCELFEGDGIVFAQGEPPMCLWCMGGRRLTSGYASVISNIIADNSVKELQRLEDQKYVEAVDAEIARQRGT